MLNKREKSIIELVVKIVFCIALFFIAVEIGINLARIGGY